MKSVYKLCYIIIPLKPEPYFRFIYLEIMYPGIACNKIIPVVKTKDLCFEENDAKAKLPAITSPSVNISSSDDAYLITIATPGLHREDFQIETENAVISISAKKRTTPSKFNKDRCEYNYAEWTRAFRLPSGCRCYYDPGKIFKRRINYTITKMRIVRK